MPKSLTDFTTVQFVRDGDVVLVGEEHRNSRCAALCERVLDEIDAGTLAAERCPGQRDSRSGAMGVVYQHATNTGKPYLRVDGEHTFTDLPVQTGQFHRDANTFTHPIEEDGDLNPKAIQNSRHLIVELYGQEAARRLHEEREAIMASYLRWAAENMPTPVVCALGTFHILAVAERVERDGATSRPSSDRLMNY